MRLASEMSGPDRNWTRSRCQLRVHSMPWFYTAKYGGSGSVFDCGPSPSSAGVS